MSSRTRAAVERRSSTLLVLLSTQPRWLLPVVSALVLAGALFLPAAPALVCLVLLLALVGWLSYLSWPAVDARGRVLRVATLLLLVVLGVQSLTG